MSLPHLETISQHCHIVRFRKFEVAFSYATPIGFFSPATGWVLSENVFSNTTGRHLASLPGGQDKTNRLPRPEFEALLQEVLDGDQG